ncbi:MAG: hypothetical protein QXV69_05280 [Sulfolobaceae archaeon]
MYFIEKDKDSKRRDNYVRFLDKGTGILH